MKSFVVLLPQLENGYTSQGYCSVLTILIDMVSGSKNHYKKVWNTSNTSNQ